MITVHLVSKIDSTAITRSIDPQTKDQFDNDISELFTEGKETLGKFYMDFDTFDATDEQKDWVEEENS